MMLRSSPDKSIYAIPVWIVALTLAVLCLRIYLRIEDESALQTGASDLAWNNPSTLQSHSGSSDKLVLYYLKLPNCQVCRNFEKGALSNREVVGIIKESFYPVCIELNVYCPGNRYNPKELTERTRSGSTYCGAYMVPYLVVKTDDGRLIDSNMCDDSADSLVGFLERAKLKSLEQNALIAIGQGDYDTAGDAFRRCRKSKYFTGSMDVFFGLWFVLKAKGDNLGADALVKEFAAIERVSYGKERRCPNPYYSISPALFDYLLGRIDEKTVLLSIDSEPSSFSSIHLAIGLDKLLDGQIDKSIEYLDKASSRDMADLLSNYLKSRKLGRSFYVDGVLRRY